MWAIQDVWRTGNKLAAHLEAHRITSWSYSFKTAPSPPSVQPKIATGRRLVAVAPRAVAAVTDPFGPNSGGPSPLAYMAHAVRSPRAEPAVDGGVDYALPALDTTTGCSGCLARGARPRTAHETGKRACNAGKAQARSVIPKQRSSVTRE